MSTTPKTTENAGALSRLQRRVTRRFRSFALRRQLYRWMPLSWSGKLLLRKPNEEDMEWARKQIKRAPYNEEAHPRRNLAHRRETNHE